MGVTAVLADKPISRQADAIGAEATDCLIQELLTHPKPGLVSQRDCGSHTDMNAAMLYRSALVLQPFFGELAEAGAADAEMSRLRQIGLRAEAEMLRATGGINTHRGAIFGLGLLCAGAGLRHARGEGISLGEIVTKRWGAAIACMPASATSHGAFVCRRFGVSGARGEAAAGFPSAYGIGLPALQAGRRLAPGNAEAARIQCCMALIAILDDTNLLHRGGQAGLIFAQQAAQSFLTHGGVGQPGWQQDALVIHRQFVRRRLSPGGAADLLSMTLFIDRQAA